jgi:phosphohistidine swiveling domain-containing protein
VPADRAYLEAVRPLAAADADALWLLDFHAPHGLTPLALAVFEAAIFGSQAAADLVPVRGSDGLRGRLWGSHPYVSSAAVASADDRESRTVRAASRIPDLLAGFSAAWSGAVAELDMRYERFAAAERRTASPAAARALLADAVVLVRRAWLIHFEFMYPLLEGYEQLLGLVRRLEIDPQLVPRLLQGYPTRITQIDRALWDVARTVVLRGLADEMKAVAPEELQHWLSDESQAVAAVRAEVETVIDQFGWRTDSVYEVMRPPWGEDMAPLLRQVQQLLDEARDRSFDDVLRQSADARGAAEAEARAGLADSARRALAAALERTRSANFAWWNEEHNAAIDMRAHVPLRRAAKLAAERFDLPSPELVFFVFLRELEQFAEGHGDRAALMEAAEERAALHARWATLRPNLPDSAGAAPDGVADPVLAEIFGVGTTSPEARTTHQASGAVLRGLPAAPGRARGRARVVPGPDQLQSLCKGEILVCEASTPAWTPAFGTIAACICSAGGSLTHAAIVCREYGIPCVTSVHGATRSIATGAAVEVDGTKGLVQVF